MSSAPRHSASPPHREVRRNLLPGTTGTILGTLLGAALLLAAPAAAQPLQALRMGQPVNAELTERDPSFVERGRFHPYRFDATAGQTYILTLRSSAFDPYLFIAWSVGGLTEVLAFNDDAGGGMDSRLRWRAPATGSYLVVAQSLVSEGSGPYTLLVDRAPQPTTAAARPIRAGETVTGELTDTDAVDESDDSFYDSYTVQARRGQRLRVEMRSDSFDTFLAFGPAGGEWEASETDDDGLGEGTNSRLLITIPADGEYLIRANAIGQSALGPYTLTLAERPPPAPAVAQPLAAGAELAGSLDEGDAETTDGSLYDLYAFTGRAGERVTVRMSSARFDTYLALGRGGPGAFQELASNDDGGEGTDSVLEFTLPADGEYHLRAQALTPGGQGAYQLRLHAAR